jgi:hypothetical protein
MPGFFRIHTLTILSAIITIFLTKSYSLRCQTPEILILPDAPASGSEQASPLVYWQEIRQTPRPLHLHFLRFDMTNPALEFSTFIADDPDGNGPAEAVLTPPDDLALKFHAVAAVNANAFRSLPDSAGRRDSVWFSGKQVDIAGLAASDSDVRSGDEQDRNEFWIDETGRAHIGDMQKTEPVKQGVADWLDAILRHGDIIAKVSLDLHPRTLIGIDASGRWLYFAVIDGRSPGYSEGITLIEAGQIMIDIGCYDALNLDGGGSSVMLVSVGDSLRVMNRPPTGLRPVPVMAGIRQRIIAPANK